MAALNDEQKLFLLEGFAMFIPPVELREEFKAEYGIAIDRRQAHYYNAEKVDNRQKLKDEWVEYFDRVREAFLEKREGIAIAHKAVRMRRLEKIADEAHSMRNYRMEMSALEQAAKEDGGAYTNRREVSGPNGGPIETKARVEVYLPDNGRSQSGTDSE